MRIIITFIFILFLPCFSKAQSSAIDSLQQALQKEKQDTGRVLLLFHLTRAYMYSRPDTALVLAQQGLSLAKKIGFEKGKAISLSGMATVFTLTGNYPKALQLNLGALKKAEAIEDKEMAARILTITGVIYGQQNNYRQAVDYFHKSLSLSKNLQDEERISINLINLGDAYEKLNILDSAKSYTTQAYERGVQANNASMTGISLNNLGNIYAKQGQYALAMKNYKLSLPFYQQEHDEEGFSEAYLGMAKLFRTANHLDSALHYAKLSLAAAQRGGFTSRVMDASNFLTGYYTALGNVDSAFVYQSATIAAKDSLFSQEKQQEIQNLSYEEMARQQQIEEAKEEAQTQMKFNLLFGGLFALLVIAYLLYRNSRQKQKAYTLVQRQKQETEKAYEQLKETQTQLVQREKMASLGELTAGIAHEIQNPLNFVKNFSEVSAEQVEELERAAIEGNREEVRVIAADMRSNLQKVVYHGQRADSIVKSMQQHSRANTGEKEPIDINALVDEYLRLCYQGMRAKDKSFSATIDTQFDNSIGQVAVVPQDIGRVLLNLYNNAFYAVQNKKQQLNGIFEPFVSVSTERKGNSVVIAVKDNGTGMPEKVTEKVFQPFFTTKPTGEGTGLGLSLSYDIITKGHGGNLSVHSTEGEGSEFVAQLPVC